MSWNSYMFYAPLQVRCIDSETGAGVEGFTIKAYDVTDLVKVWLWGCESELLTKRLLVESTPFLISDAWHAVLCCGLQGMPESALPPQLQAKRTRLIESELQAQVLTARCEDCGVIEV